MWGQVPPVRGEKKEEKRRKKKKKKERKKRQEETGRGSQEPWCGTRNY
jgi:hypothetical protein